MELRVLRPYVFLGITKTKMSLKENLESSGFDGQVSSFVGPSEQVYLAKSESHIEPLLSLIAYLDSRITFEETYFGCEVKLANADLAKPSTVNLVIVPIHYQTDVFMRAWHYAFWKAYRMLGGKWAFLYPNPKDTQCQVIMETVREAGTKDIVGLSPFEDLSFPRLPKRKKQTDPTRAMIREAKYQLMHAQSYADSELLWIRPKSKSKSLRRRRTFLDHRSQFFCSLLEKEVEIIRGALEGLDAESISIQKAIATLDEFESIKNIVESPHGPHRKPAQLRRQLLNSEEIFRVEDAFVFEGYKSVRLTCPCPIVVPSVGYYFRIREVCGNVRLIELPVTVGLRLGLLPILFHIIAHCFVRDKRHKLEVRQKALSRELGWLLRFPKCNCGKTNKKESDLAIEELLSDIIAVEIGGPAYFYALRRGFAFEPGLCENPCLRVQDRLHVVHSYLQAKGFDIEPSTLCYETNENQTISSVVRELVELIPSMNMASNYSIETHKTTTEGVKAELMEGRVLSSRPSIVVNALWKAVLERRGYLNENAAFLSILEWSRSARADR